MFGKLGYALTPLFLVALVVVAIPAAMLGADTTAQAAEQRALSLILTIPGGGAIEVPTKMKGSWTSDADSRWGGKLYLRNISAVAGESISFTGEIQFANSDCSFYKPFTGYATTGGHLVITAELGGECGQVIVELSKAEGGKMWGGTYRADYPDYGDVTLSPS